ncbi:MAG: ribosome recycling factor [bacterium]|nr:ribosome recycling factor [bacterium]
MDTIDSLRQKMTKVIDLISSDLASLRAGRATPALVEKVVVEAYETKMPLVELATISGQGSELTVTPFDQTIVKNIEKALSMDRGLGIMPAVDGVIIRLKIPPLTEEKRLELVKLLHQKMESAKIMIRQVRGDFMADAKRAFESKAIFENDRRDLEEEVQKLTDEMNGKIEDLGEAKEAELTTI